MKRILLLAVLIISINIFAFSQVEIIKSGNGSISATPNSIGTIDDISQYKEVWVGVRVDTCTNNCITLVQVYGSDGDKGYLLGQESIKSTDSIMIRIPAGPKKLDIRAQLTNGNPTTAFWEAWGTPFAAGSSEPACWQYKVLPPVSALETNLNEWPTWELSQVLLVSGVGTGARYTIILKQKVGCSLKLNIAPKFRLAGKNGKK